MILSFQDSVRAIWDWIQQYIGTTPAFLCLSVAALIHLLVTCKAFREKTLAAAVVLVVLVLNPLLYSLVYGNLNLPFVSSYGLRYWRFFWLLPQGLVIGASALRLIQRAKRPAFRWLGLLAAAGIIVLCGQNIFLKDFAPAESPYKLSPRVQEICEAILADEAEPLCMFDSPMTAQVREYDGSIRQLWGRNGNWNIVNDPQVLEIYGLLQERPRDWERAFAFAEEKGVTHISYSTRKAEDQEEIMAIAGRHGYTPFATVEKRILFHRAKAQS